MRRISKERLRAVLIKEDPAGIYFPDLNNVDEYDSEIDVILEKLPNCQSEEDIKNLVWTTFVRFFGKNTAGDLEMYKSIAHKLWILFHESKK